MRDSHYYFNDKGKQICKHTQFECPINDIVAGSSCSICSSNPEARNIYTATLSSTPQEATEGDRQFSYFIERTDTNEWYMLVHNKGRFWSNDPHEAFDCESKQRGLDHIKEGVRDGNGRLDKMDNLIIIEHEFIDIFKSEAIERKECLDDHCNYNDSGVCKNELLYDKCKYRISGKQPEIEQSKKSDIELCRQDHDEEIVSIQSKTRPEQSEATEGKKPCGDCENYAEYDGALRYCSICGTKLPIEPEGAKELPKGWTDFNTLSVEECIKYLNEKFKFNSSGASRCIATLINEVNKLSKIKKMAQKLNEDAKVKRVLAMKGTNQYNAGLYSGKIEVLTKIQKEIDK